MTEPPICPCEGFSHPQVIFNPPGRSPVFYRIGDYSSFRRALLLPLKDADGNLLESELTNWHPGAEGDLAVQMVEWWAYLADILTFYSDRIANESYLQTASFTESVQQLVRILGYRPRPGIGARGVVAALTNSSKPFTLPQGFQIQSKPGPGKQPQIFELDADSPIQFPDVIPAEPLPNKLLDPADVLLKGSVSAVKVGEEVLLLKRNWDGSDNDYAWAVVESVKAEKDPWGNTNTRFRLAVLQSGVPGGADAENYRLLKSNQSAHLYSFQTDHVIATDHLHLESVQRNIKVGNPVLLENSVLDSKYRLISITQYTELLWYANTSSSANPSQPPASDTEPAIPILHTRLYFLPSFTNSLATEWNNNRGQALVRFGWQEVGQIIAQPKDLFDVTSPIPKLSPELQNPASNRATQLIVEDTEKQGILAIGRTGESSSSIDLSEIHGSPSSLKAPLSILLNLLPVSRGQTVSEEILGSGNASIAAQEFLLKKSPLTYLLSSDSSSGGNYKSTLRIWVDGIEWKEVPSFYGQPPHARIFITREDEQQRTTVQFGDGINGARLPSGVDNVIARYRYGSGREAPDAGSLNVIVKPYPNLKAIRNPVPVGGGADPEPPDRIRRYAPQSVLTFGRAVSGDDYEAIAAQTPGVSRAKVYWTWDPAQQRSLVKLYVGDDNSAVSAAKLALAGTADPNRPVLVELAQPLPMKIDLRLQIEATRIPETVKAAVKVALLNPDTGLFGINAIQIGQAIYQSQIYSTCLQVPGVLAVHSLTFSPKPDPVKPDTESTSASDYPHVPEEGKFYQLLETDLTIN